jgi:hypothetical protein
MELKQGNNDYNAMLSKGEEDGKFDLYQSSTTSSVL